MTGGRGRAFERPAEDPDRPRLFFAAPLPDDVREAIRPVRDAVQGAVGDGHARIRWVRIESLHLTLRFIGPTALDRAEALGRVADGVAATVAPFEVLIAGSGAFPAYGRPRTLWLGIERGADGLARLAAGLADGLADGLARGPAGDDGARDDGIRDDRPFSAHLTLARTDGLHLAAEAARALGEAAAGREWSFVADRIVLYRSHLGSGPAWYEPIHESRLAG
ncbi:MAG: RNA 2',3'-cyclic phosphodiesterase [Chloroflexi bacterium]|nr:RNA 2',3'-cyclic phosphodiesterase [Chloroflexota bacterium]